MAELIINSGSSAWLDQANPTEVQNASSALSVVGSVGTWKRALLAISLVGLPAGATLSEATLQIYRQAGISASAGHSLFRVTEAFLAAQATWNNRLTSTAWTSAGGTFAASPSAALLEGHDQYVNADVLALVEAAIAAGQSALLVMIRSADEGEFGISEKFYSPFGSANPPVLTIAYTLPMGPAAGGRRAAIGVGVGVGV